MKKNKLERIFVNPFSEPFLSTWELWKEYKKEEWKFQYKSVLSEQAAINLLVRLSGGDEKMAAAIIRQSMENRWQGLFPYKNLTQNFKKKLKRKRTQKCKSWKNKP